ncbi:hypothetical protein ACN42_g7062 [Penicillium freii]|uniref:Uncharacterized protein n=1 Tax=Penicillium freii TaxID=48697 RepID=A0A124GR38_PENFR|nr:hypothetical protein ACN42_g7062 [Penicillium freii]
MSANQFLLIEHGPSIHGSLNITKHILSNQLITPGPCAVKYSASRTLSALIKRRHPDRENRDRGLKSGMYNYICRQCRCKRDPEINFSIPLGPYPITDLLRANSIPSSLAAPDIISR